MSRFRALVADDDLHCRESIVSLLRAEGVEAVAVPGGRAVVRLVTATFVREVDKYDSRGAEQSSESTGIDSETQGSRELSPDESQLDPDPQLDSGSPPEPRSRNRGQSSARTTSSRAPSRFDRDRFISDSISDSSEISSSSESDDAVGESRVWLPKLQFDFMVLDYNLPDISGIEVLKILRNSLRTSLPAILVSGELTEQIEASLRELGGFGALPKPLKPDRFRGLLRQLVDSEFFNSN